MLILVNSQQWWWRSRRKCWGEDVWETWSTNWEGGRGHPGQVSQKPRPDFQNPSVLGREVFWGDHEKDITPIISRYNLLFLMIQRELLWSRGTIFVDYQTNTSPANLNVWPVRPDAQKPSTTMGITQQMLAQRAFIKRALTTSTYIAWGAIRYASHWINSEASKPQTLKGFYTSRETRYQKCKKDFLFAFYLGM